MTGPEPTETERSEREGACWEPATGVFGPLRDWIYPPVGRPQKFTPEFTDDFRPGPESAEELLDEAKSLVDFAFQRGDAADRRATTLVGAVAIAASFTLAAGSLVAGSDKIASHSWRIVFAAAAAVVILAFVIAGVFALQATSRIRCWRYPDDERGFTSRGKTGLATARIERAIELLEAYGENAAYVTWKIERATLAARWFRIAVAALVLLALLFVVYVAAAGSPGSPAP